MSGDVAITRSLDTIGLSFALALACQRPSQA